MSATDVESSSTRRERVVTATDVKSSSTALRSCMRQSPGTTPQKVIRVLAYSPRKGRTTQHGTANEEKTTHVLPAWLYNFCLEEKNSRKNGTASKEKTTHVLPGYTVLA